MRPTLPTPPNASTATLVNFEVLSNLYSDSIFYKFVDIFKKNAVTRELLTERPSLCYAHRFTYIDTPNLQRLTFCWV